MFLRIQAYIQLVSFSTVIKGYPFPLTQFLIFVVLSLQRFTGYFSSNAIKPITYFFYKKKVYKKMRLKLSEYYKNCKEITRLNFSKLSVFIGQNRYFVTIAFKMLKMEFKFKYIILTRKV